MISIIVSWHKTREEYIYISKLLKVSKFNHLAWNLVEILTLYNEKIANKDKKNPNLV